MKRLTTALLVLLALPSLGFEWEGRLTRLRRELNWPAIMGGGFLAGIGFTMALFIAGLALDGPLLDSAKIGILMGSAVSAVIGLAVLATVLRRGALMKEIG